MKNKLRSVNMLLMAAVLVVTSSIGVVYAFEGTETAPTTEVPATEPVTDEQEPTETAPIETAPTDPVSDENKPTPPKKNDEGQKEKETPAQEQSPSKENNNQNDKVGKLTKRQPISISREDKIALRHEGFSYDEIDAAVMLANELQVQDVGSLLRGKRDEVKAYQEKLEKAPLAKKEDAIPADVMQYWLSQGFSEQEIFFARHASKKMGVTLEEALQAIKNNDVQFIEAVVKQGGEDQKNNAQ